MERPSIARALALSAALAAAFSLAPARAAPPSASQIAVQKREAGKLADVALAAFEAGRFADAYAGFEKAEQRFHAPTFLLFMARSRVGLGQLVAAKALLQKIADEQLATYAPQEFFDAQVEGKADLAALAPRIPTLRVTVSGAPASAVELTIDAEPFANSSLGQAVPFDPGMHTVRAVTPGAAPDERTFVLREHSAEVVALSLAVAPAAPPPTSSAPKPLPPAAGSLVPAAVAGGVGVAALAAGVVTGVWTQSRVGELADLCPHKRCATTAAQDKLDEGQRSAAASTAMFVLAGAGLAAGGVLLVWRPFGKKDVTAAAGPTWISVRGRF